MGKSNIEWTTETWNPVVGCSVVSPGCTNCYAMKEAYRFGFNPQLDRYQGLTKLVNDRPVWTGKLHQAPENTLLRPLKRKQPTTYFVNSMGDLFHEDCPDAWIDCVFAVMALAPQHTFQVLTKRAARMRDYFAVRGPSRKLRICEAMGLTLGGTDIAKKYLDPDNKDHWTEDGRSKVVQFAWPLPNIWLGVSTERQQEADERIPLLLQTPAAVRFISAEPLLGPISLRWAKWDNWIGPNGLRRETVDHLDGARMLDWVIVGGESGPDARPMHPDWARELRVQCQEAGVPFFFKQWGNWHPEIDRDKDDPDWRRPYTNYREPNFQILNLAGGRGFHGERVHVMRYCSKKSAGRALDGIEYNEMPEARA